MAQPLGPEYGSWCRIESQMPPKATRMTMARTTDSSGGVGWDRGRGCWVARVSRAPGRPGAGGCAASSASPLCHKVDATLWGKVKRLLLFATGRFVELVGVDVSPDDLRASF